MYPEIMVIPMREELTRAGIAEARTAADVDAALAQPGNDDGGGELHLWMCGRQDASGSSPGDAACGEA